MDQTQKIIIFIINITSVLILLPSLVYSQIQYKNNKEQYGIYRLLIVTIILILIYTSGPLLNSFNNIIRERTSKDYRLYILIYIVPVQIIFDALQQIALIHFIVDLSTNYQIKNIFVPFQNAMKNQNQKYWKIHYFLFVFWELIATIQYLYQLYCPPNKQLEAKIRISFFTFQIIFDLYTAIIPLLLSIQLKKSKHQVNITLFICLFLINGLNFVVRLYDILQCCLNSLNDYFKWLALKEDPNISSICKKLDFGARILTQINVIVKDSCIFVIVFVLSKIFRDYKEMQQLLGECKG